MPKNWFNNIETKSEMNSFAIGVISVIIGEIHTTAEAKVAEIAETLRNLDLAWGMKKAPAATEATRETTQPKCSIDVSKIESLLNMPRAQECLKCDCFKCDGLDSCHIMFPTTLYHCQTKCAGKSGVVNCEYKS